MRPINLLEPFRSERGIALPTALIALALLTTLLIAFAVLSKSEPIIASNQARAAQARVLSEAGVERALYALTSTIIPNPMVGPVAPAPYDASCTGSTCTPTSSYLALGSIGGFFVQVAAGPVNNERTIDAWGWAPTYSSTGYTASNVPVAHKHIHLTLKTMPFVNPNLMPPAALAVRGEVQVGPSNSALVDGATDTSCGNKSGTYSTGAATINHPGNVTGTPPSAPNVPASTFDQYIFTDSDLDMLKQLAKQYGRYLQGSQSFNSSNPIPINGLVFVDTTSGNNLSCTPTPPTTCTNPSSDNITVTITGNAGPGGSGAFNGWLIVNGSISWTGNTNLNGLVYAQNDLTASGTGTVTGTVVTRNIQDTSLTSIDTGVSGNKAVNFSCDNVKHGGGNVMDSILNSVPVGWFLKAGTYREVTD